MDYARIYRELINDRRINAPHADEYVEVHHVVPRCMGGGDEAENLVRLKPEDHFFAHLLLAHVHDTRELWAACVLMTGNRWAEVNRFRRLYGSIKRRNALLSRGASAPRADQTVYRFYHLDGDEFVGTRMEFGSAKSVPPASVNNLINGSAIAVYGWCTAKMSRAEYTVRRSASASSAGKKLRGFVRDKAIWRFYNDELNTSVAATQVGMRSIGFLDESKVSGLVTGQRFVSDGWCLLENAEWAYGAARPSGKDNHRYNHEVFDFINDLTGESLSSTVHEMGRSHNGGDSRPFGEIARAVTGGWRGWRLIGAPKTRIEGLRYSLLKDDKTISGTQRELMAIVGVTQMSISNMVTGKTKSTKGWSFVGRVANDNLPSRTAA